MKNIIEKGTMITPNKEEAPYIITMDKEIMCIEAKNEKKLHIYSIVNQDIYFFILGILDIMFEHLEPVVEKRLHINIKIFYERNIDEYDDEIVRRSHHIHHLKEKGKNIEDSIQSIKSKFHYMNEIHGILLIKDIKIQIIY